MTTSPVMTVTDELLAELEAATSNATGGEWEYNMGLIRTMADSDGYVPVSVAPNVPSNWRKQRDRNMQYIALASPATITALTAELRRLRAENAELGGLLREAGKTIHKLQAEQPTPLRIARYLDAMRAKIDAAMATK